MFDKVFVKACLTRGFRTFFQSVAAMLPAAAMISEVDWKVVLGTSALAFVASIATSLAGLPEVELQREDA